MYYCRQAEVMKRIIGEVDKQGGELGVHVSVNVFDFPVKNTVKNHF